MEIVGQIEEGISAGVMRLGGTGLEEEDLSCLADDVATGERVAADIGGVWRRDRGDLSGERASGG